VEAVRQKRIGKFDMALQGEGDIISSRLWKQGLWEPTESVICQRFVNKGDITVDVGAHIGYWTLLLSHWVGPDGVVVAFEPEVNNFLYLEENTALNNTQNTSLWRRAVGERSLDTTVKLYLTGENSGHHSLFEVPETTGHVDINITSLDDYFKPGSRVDFVKIDTEGNEVPVLLGMTRVIEENPNITIMTEFSEENFENGDHDIRDYYSMLRELGFDVWMMLQGTKELGEVTDDNLEWVIKYKEQGLPFRNILCTKGDV